MSTCWGLLKKIRLWQGAPNQTANLSYKVSSQFGVKLPSGCSQLCAADGPVIVTVTLAVTRVFTVVVTGAGDATATSATPAPFFLLLLALILLLLRCCLCCCYYWCCPRIVFLMVCLTLQSPSHINIPICPLPGGSWDLVTPYNWSYNPAYNFPKSACGG